MTQAYRPPDEQYLTALSALTNRVAKLERSGAGLPGTVAFASSDLVLTGVYTDVPGTTIPIVQPGRYMFVAIADLDWTVAFAGATATGLVVTTGATLPTSGTALSDGGVVNRKTVACSGFASYASTGTMNLQSARFGGGGTCTIRGLGTSTCLLAIRTGPA